MSKSYWFRVAMMILSFVAVVVTIRYLRSPENILVAGGKSFAPLPSATGTYNLCPTRISWIETPEGLRIEETQTKWSRTLNGAERVELDSIAVEKWLSNFCSLLTREVPHQEGGTFTSALKVGYVSGEPQTLNKSGSVFELQGHNFSSVDLENAIGAVKQIPIASEPH